MYQMIYTSCAFFHGVWGGGYPFFHLFFWEDSSAKSERSARSGGCFSPDFWCQFRVMGFGIDLFFLCQLKMGMNRNSTFRIPASWLPFVKDDRNMAPSRILPMPWRSTTVLKPWRLQRLVWHWEVISRPGKLRIFAVFYQTIQGDSFASIVSISGIYISWLDLQYQYINININILYI